MCHLRRDLGRPIMEGHRLGSKGNEQETIEIMNGNRMQAERRALDAEFLRRRRP